MKLHLGIFLLVYGRQYLRRETSKDRQEVSKKTAVSIDSKATTTVDVIDSKAITMSDTIPTEWHGPSKPVVKEEAIKVVSIEKKHDDEFHVKGIAALEKTKKKNSEAAVKALRTRHEDKSPTTPLTAGEIDKAATIPAAAIESHTDKKSMSGEKGSATLDSNKGGKNDRSHDRESKTSDSERGDVDPKKTDVDNKKHESSSEGISPTAKSTQATSLGHSHDAQSSSPHGDSQSTSPHETRSSSRVSQSTPSEETSPHTSNSESFLETPSDGTIFRSPRFPAASENMFDLKVGRDGPMSGPSSTASIGVTPYCSSQDKLELRTKALETQRSMLEFALSNLNLRLNQAGEILKNSWDVNADDSRLWGVEFQDAFANASAAKECLFWLVDYIKEKAQNYPQEVSSHDPILDDKNENSMESVAEMVGTLELEQTKKVMKSLERRYKTYFHNAPQSLEKRPETRHSEEQQLRDRMREDSPNPLRTPFERWQAERALGGETFSGTSDNSVPAVINAYVRHLEGEERHATRMRNDFRDYQQHIDEANSKLPSLAEYPASESGKAVSDLQNSIPSFINHTRKKLKDIMSR